MSYTHPLYRLFKCLQSSQAEVAELQAFKEELCKVCGSDVLNIKRFG